MSRFFALFSQAISFIQAHPRKGIAILGVVVLALFFGFGAFTNKQDVVTLTVTPKEFLQQVSVSGKVTPANDVQLAFEETGRVSSIVVAVGDAVKEGEPLVYLDAGTLEADLRAAQAQVAVKRVELDNRGVNLEKVKDEQDTLVTSAKRALFSEGLEAVAFSKGYAVRAPVVSGIYKSEEAGTYKFSIEQKYPGSPDMEIRVFDLEQVKGVPVPDSEAAPLGTRGLYVSFPDGPEVYRNTTWYVTIPNVRSSSYVKNYNAYQEALRTREKAISDAEADLSGRSVGTAIAVSELRKAEAEVERIRAELSKRTLRAPFAGVITAVDAELGKAVSVNDSAVSLISADALQIESYVPEINISYLSVGDASEVTLDAYGTDTVFPAHVAAIDPAETIRDGVSTYRIILHLDTKDERVRSGMTANIIITTDKRDGVIAIPQGAVRERNGKKIVFVLTASDKQEAREVTVGPVSSLGEVEILSGLSGGERVVLPTTK